MYVNRRLKPAWLCVLIVLWAWIRTRAYESADSQQQRLVQSQLICLESMVISRGGLVSRSRITHQHTHVHRVLHRQNSTPFFQHIWKKKTPSFFCTIEEEWTPSFKLPSPLIRPHNPSLSALISSNFTSIHFGPVSSEIYYLTTQGTSRKRFITVQGRTESKSMQKCIKVRTGCRQHGTCSALHSLHDLTGPRNTTTVFPWSNMFSNRL